jgi:hypothetical protein
VTIIQRAFIVVSSVLLVTAPSWAFQAPAAQDGFVPVNELPPTEQLPAAPFLIGAYAFFLVLMVGYIWSVARRLSRVEKEMAVLEQRQLHGGASR